MLLFGAVALAGADLFPSGGEVFAGFDDDRVAGIGIHTQRDFFAGEHLTDHILGQFAVKAHCAVEVHQA